MNIRKIDDDLKELSKRGRIFFYGSTSVLKYKRRQIKIYKILTDINVAEIGRYFPNLIFSGGCNFDCYTILDENTILTFLIIEDGVKDNFEYLESIYQIENNPLFLLFYSPIEDKYYSMNEKFLDSLGKNSCNIVIEKQLFIDDLLDISLLASETELSIKINSINISRFNDKSNYYYNDDNFQKFLPFLELTLTSLNPYKGFLFLEKINLLSFFFPFLNDLKGIEQDRYLHPEGDVFQHTMQCFKYVKNPSLRLTLGLLLHDYGKSISRGQNGSGFKFHSSSGAKKVKEILTPFGYSETLIKDVEFLVEFHMINSYFHRISNDDKERLFNNALGLELLKLYKADTLGSTGKMDLYYDVLSHLKKNIKCKVLVGNAN